MDALDVGRSDGTVVADNLFIGGKPDCGGIATGSHTLVTGNTIVGFLVGLGMSSNAVVTARNNLINQCGYGVVVNLVDPVPVFSFANNCVSESIWADYARFPTGPFMLPGDLHVVPGFVAPGSWDLNETPSSDDDIYIAGDYRLTRTSPLINAGDPTVDVEVGALDAFGHVRVASGGVDIGAHEYPALGDLDGDGLRTYFDLDAFVLGLVDRTAHDAAFPLADTVTAGDINGDGRFDMFDIDPFVECLVGAGCP